MPHIEGSRLPSGGSTGQGDMDAVTAGLAGAVFPALFPPIEDEGTLGPAIGAGRREWFRKRSRSVRGKDFELDDWFAHRRFAQQGPGRTRTLPSNRYVMQTTSTPATATVPVGVPPCFDRMLPTRTQALGLEHLGCTGWFRRDLPLPHMATSLPNREPRQSLPRAFV